MPSDPVVPATPPTSTAIERCAAWFERYAIVSPKVGSRSTRPLVWWALALRGKLNAGRITVEDVEEACRRVARIRVNPTTGETNIIGGVSFSMYRGGGR